jgi:hypothetical protein
MQAYTNKEVERLKLLRELKEIDQEEKDKELRRRRMEEERKLLEQKRRMLEPVRFEEIRRH